MSQVLSYFKVKETENQVDDNPIATSRGPNNTLLVTYDKSLSIYAQLPTSEPTVSAPVQTFSLNQAYKRLKRKKTNSNIPLVPEISAFTSEALYDPNTQQLIVVTDSTHILTFPSTGNASLFDGAHWEVFDPSFAEEFNTHIHSIILHPTLPTHLLIVDNWARLHSFPIPTKTGSPLLLNRKSNTPRSTINKIKQNIRNNTAPILHWVGLITVEHLLVATQYGMICYNLNTTNIVDEVSFFHANTYCHNQTSLTTTTTKSSKTTTTTSTATINHGTTGSTLPIIANISSFRKDSDRPPRFFASSIPQAVLYTDGHLEIYNFNLLTHKFSLVYARTLSQPYTLPFSRVQVITPQHLAILTPSNPAITDTIAQDIKYFLIDLTYYTISAYQVIKKPLSPPPAITYTPSKKNADSPTIVNKAQHAFQIDFSGMRTVVAATYIINDQINVFVTKPQLPTLALSIGCATRDAPFWASISRINMKSTVLSASNRDDPVQHGEETPAKISELSQTYLQFPDTTGSFISLLQPRCAVPMGNDPSEQPDQPQQLNQSKPRQTTANGKLITDPLSSATSSAAASSSSSKGAKNQADVKDVILTLSSQTLPMLNPFSPKPIMQSLSNHIDKVRPPSTLLMQTATMATTTLDAVILENWSSYLIQCDKMERLSLMKMLPRLIPYLTTSSPTIDDSSIKSAEEHSIALSATPSASKKRARESPAHNSNKDALANFTNANTSTELSADIFLYEFFSYCAAYAQDVPNVSTVTSVPLPSNSLHIDLIAKSSKNKTYNIQESIKSHTKCPCKVNQTAPPESIREDPIAQANPNNANINNSKDSNKLSKHHTKQLSPATNVSQSASLTPSQQQQLDNNTQLQTFVTQLVFEPCAWKALLGSMISLTNIKTSYHTLKSIAFHNTNLLSNLAHNHNNNNGVGYSQLLRDTVLRPIQPLCLRSNKIVITKPLSPLFNHLLFRECLRKIDSICCHNCPNILYLLPLEILIANCMMNSSLAITCVKIGLKHKLWSLISSIITASNISHSESFIDIMIAVLDDLSDNFSGTVEQLYTIGVIEDDIDDASHPQQPAKPTKAMKKAKKLAMSDSIDSSASIIPTVEDITASQAGQHKIPSSKALRAPTTIPTNNRQLHDLNSFCTKAHCTCNPATTPPLFSSRPAPSNFLAQYPYISSFVAATIPQQSATCVLFTLLSSPITEDILIQQLHYLPLDYVLLLLNILSLLFQATLGQIPLPQWLSPCSDCYRHLTPEYLLKWITMLIDSHAKELMIAQHLLHPTQYNSLNVFASLHCLIHAYCTGNAELLESVMGITEQLTILKELGVTKLNVTEPYSIQIVKF